MVKPSFFCVLLFSLCIGVTLTIPQHISAQSSDPTVCDADIIDTSTPTQPVSYVDLSDYSTMVRDFFRGDAEKPLLNPRSNINKVGIVDLSDYHWLVAHFGKVCPKTTPSPTVTVSLTPSRTPTRTPTASPTVSVAPGQAKAFPGAEGYGTNTKGGRGGKVVLVTNTNNSGPGSLRYALEDVDGPRIVVFTVGGTITLDSMIYMEGANKAPYRDNQVTILGQTAPGGGISLRGRGISMRCVNDVIVRYIRTRNGPVGGSSDIDGIELDGGYDCEEDKPIKNVVIDHVSAQWAWDENLNLYEAGEDITFSYNLIGEAQSGGQRGPAKGLLIGSDNPNNRAKNISIHNNLFISNPDRNPRASAYNLDMVNNYIFNWGANNATPLGNYHDHPNYPNTFNMIGNVWKAGKNSSASDNVIWINRDDGKLYLSGNASNNCPAPCLNQWSIGIGDSDTEQRITNPGSTLSSTQFSSTAMPSTIRPANQLWAHLKPRVGALAPQRDSVDTRLINEVDIPNNSPDAASLKAGGSQASQWPDLATGTYPTDSDADGIPNSWETANGLNPNNGSDSALIAPSGYAWIEEYANSLVPQM